MYPYLYQTDTLTIGSYGVMLAIAYLVGRHLYIKQLNQISTKPVNTELLIVSLLIFGVIGAKLMFVLKNPQEASLSDWSSLTSGSGFSSQGAIFAAILVTMVFAHFSQVKLSNLLDAAAPAAVLAYAIARIGCFLAGDDCYGVPSDLPWAMSFPHGVAETHDQVHPLPIYEMLYSLAIWAYLTHRQKTDYAAYSQFFLLLLSWGACRFLVEFISTNPEKVFGLSGSQFGALLMMLAGISYLAFNSINGGQKKAG